MRSASLQTSVRDRFEGVSDDSVWFMGYSLGTECTAIEQLLGLCVS